MNFIQINSGLDPDGEPDFINLDRVDKITYICSYLADDSSFAKIMFQGLNDGHLCNIGEHYLVDPTDVSTKLYYFLSQTLKQGNDDDI